MPSNASQ